MRTIPHRELRNQSSKILDEVSKGGVVEVTNHGEVVAVIVPPKRSRYDLLVAAGQIHPGIEKNELWAAIPTIGLPEDSIVALDELRS
jgi:prevent-host-death family protein